MSISHEEIRHVAHMARIELTEAEIASLGKDLGGILAFIETLNTLDTTETTPMTGGTILANVTRSDTATDAKIQDASERLINAAPETSDGYIKVRSIFHS